MVASLLERQPTLIPRYNYYLPEPLRNCGVVWGNGETMFTGEAGSGPPIAGGPVAGRRRAGGPQGPAQTDFFRLLTGAQGTIGIVTWAAVKCELSPPPTSTAFVTAAELEELVDFIYRLDRIRLGDEVFIVNEAYLAPLLAPRRTSGRLRDGCPPGRWSWGSAAASTSPPSASRSRRRTPAALARQSSA